MGRLDHSNKATVKARALPEVPCRLDEGGIAAMGEMHKKNPLPCGFRCVSWTAGIGRPETIKWCQEGHQKGNNSAAFKAPLKNLPSKLPLPARDTQATRQSVMASPAVASRARDVRRLGCSSPRPHCPPSPAIVCRLRCT